MKSNLVIDMRNPFLRDEAGSTAIEYSLVAVLVAMVIIATVATIGGQVLAMFMAAVLG